MGLTRPGEPVDTVIDDDLLRLIFTCCHPSLSAEARLALALRTLCQLSVAQVASGDAYHRGSDGEAVDQDPAEDHQGQDPYRVPADTELPERLTAVCGVVHALYTAGHAPIGGVSVLDVDLCMEGLRLARLLNRLLPDEAMPAAVLALVLLTEARRPARIDEHDDPVMLSDQDRSRWDQRLIKEGFGLLKPACGRTEGLADPYQLQAAIATEHDRAASYAGTDWEEILRLYDLLLSVAPSPPAALSRAVVLAERDGPEAGLATLETLPVDSRREAVRSELLARAGRPAEAAAAVSMALAGDAPEAQKRYWRQRLATWQASSGSAGDRFVQ